MKLHFSIAQIPELAGLTKPQRKAVLECAMVAFLSERPSKMWSGGLWFLGGILGGALIGGVVVSIRLAHSALIVVTACGFVGALAGIFIGTPLQHEQLRPYVRRVLEERWEEIRQIQ